MVYDWDAHKDTLHRLYVDDKRSVQDIVAFMHTHHNFSPSKRAYQAQFRRWQFPSKYQPALKNDGLMVRVRELWECNLSQVEMLRILNHEDGFSIKPRELNRVRSKHRWLLRVPSRAARAAADGDGNHRDSVALLGSPTVDGGSGNGDDDDDDANKPSMPARQAPPPPPPPLAEQRRRKMEAESAERWAAKKRRRRTRQYAGMAADPPGPPRFPSETTVGESQMILGLDKAAYNAVRNTFQAICEAAGILKKTEAGPGAWETAKQSLIGQSCALQRALWMDKDNNNSNNSNTMDGKKLALDVICSDVTKRMRSGADRDLLLADAKNILGLNPQQAREVRAAFYNALKADGFTSKVAMGPHRWNELKQKWIDESEVLHNIPSRLDDRQSHEIRTRAVEALARDVMKRVREDQSRRSRARGATTQKTGPDVATIGEDRPPGFATQTTLAPSGACDGPHAHSDPARLMPDHHHDLLASQMAMQVPIDSRLASSLLLDPVLPAPPPPPLPLPLAAPPSFDHAPPAAHGSLGFPPSPPVANTGTMPIYLRLVRHDDLDMGSGLCIAFLTSPSLQEMRQLAEHTMPGSRCVRLEGLLKMPGIEGQVVPLRIDDDDQLGVYLSQGGAPSFTAHLSL